MTGARNVMKKNVTKFQNVLFRGQYYTCGAEGHRAEDCTVKPLTEAKELQSRSNATNVPDMPEVRPCCIGMLAENGGYITARSTEVHP